MKQGLKEERVIENQNYSAPTVLSIYAMHALFRFEYSPINVIDVAPLKSISSPTSNNDVLDSISTVIWLEVVFTAVHLMKGMFGL